jgi:hypothetical protein
MAISCLYALRAAQQPDGAGVSSYGEHSQDHVDRPTAIAATTLGLLALACVVTALRALWMMLGAALESDWLPVACIASTIYLLFPRRR